MLRSVAFLLLVLPWGPLRPAHAQRPVLPSLEAGAAAKEYLHTVWTTEDGLPQNSINAIVQTRDGYLWLATFGGLARFDGVTFTTFDMANTGGLASNRMVSLYEDREGVLWIGHETGEVTRYQDGSFTSYTTVDGLPGGTVVEAFIEDEAGSLWIGTRGGLVRFADGVFTTYTRREGLPHDWVNALLLDRQGRLWVGTEGGLARYEDGTFTAYAYKEGLPSTIIGALYEDRHGTLWVGTGQGMAYYRDDHFIPFSTPGLPSGAIRVIAEDREGNLWVGAIHSPLERQLIRLGGGAGSDGPNDRSITATYPFEADIDAIYEDREGNLWVGTDGDGLHRFRERPVTRYTTEDGLPHNSVFRVTTDGEGGLWISADCGKLTRFRDGTFTTYTALPDGGKIGCVWALLRDRSGVFWIGSDDKLIRWGDQGYTRYTINDGLPGENVLSLFEDRDGALWVGTGGKGVVRFDADGLVPSTVEDGLVHGDVRFITQSQDGALWFGTREGVSRLHDGHFTSYTAVDGLSPGMVRAIYEDADGVLWIGTYGGGLSRLEDGQITRFTMDHGLFDNVVSRILEDERGNLWMLGNLGLFYVSRAQLNDVAEGRRSSIESVSFGPEEGMAEGNGGGQPAGWQTDDGRMWFPTIDGLAVIDAKHHRINEAPPPVVIERAIIDGVEVDVQGLGEVPPGDRNLEIHYTGLSFAAPEKVRFKYRLEGYEEAWQDAGTRRVAFYTNIPPGTYTFRVKAANNDGVWNEAGASLTISLAPYFYETGWFYAFSVLLLGWAGYTAFRRRTRSIQARNAALEAFNAQLNAEITERGRAEAALRKSEAHFRSLIENALDTIIILDPEATVLYISPSIVRWDFKV